MLYVGLRRKRVGLTAEKVKALEEEVGRKDAESRSLVVKIPLQPLSLQ